MDSKDYFGSIEEIRAYKAQVENQKRQNHIKYATSKKASIKRKLKRKGNKK